MSYEISKELFEAVMGFCKNEIAEMYVSDENIFWHTYEDEFIGIKDSKINIDTFFFKCKEWAYKQECELLSGYRVYDIQYKGNNSENKIYCDCKYIENGIQVIRFKADSEQQAVFDACMYILDKDKQ